MRRGFHLLLAAVVTLTLVGRSRSADVHGVPATQNTLAKLHGDTSPQAVRLAWEVRSWPDNLRGFDVKRRPQGKQGAAWEKLTRQPVVPEISASKDLLRRRVGPGRTRTPPGGQCRFGEAGTGPGGHAGPVPQVTPRRLPREPPGAAAGNAGELRPRPDHGAGLRRPPGRQGRHVRVRPVPGVRRRVGRGRPRPTSTRASISPTGTSG